MNSSNYFFAVAVNAGEDAATLPQLRKLMAERGLTLAAGFSVVLPSNYIPWGGPGTADELENRYAAARRQIPALTEQIQARRHLPLAAGPWWQNVLYSGLLHPLSYPHIQQMDKDFWVDSKCNGCKICARICPAQNIQMQDGRPQWQHHCEQCLACIQWCPQQAIQYGKKTTQYPRYHHPSVQLGDLYHGKET
jgi:ferredoxin